MTLYRIRLFETAKNMLTYEDNNPKAIIYASDKYSKINTLIIINLGHNKEFRTGINYIPLSFTRHFFFVQFDLTCSAKVPNIYFEFKSRNY